MMFLKWIVVLITFNGCLCQNVDPGYFQMLMNGAQALGNGGQQGPFSSNIIMSIVGSYLQNNQDEIIEYVTGSFKTALEDGTVNSTSATCRNHTDLFIDALLRRENWALRMIDAFGKPVPGLMEYRVNWPGNYDECISTTATVYMDPVAKIGPDHPYTGKYCTMSLQFGAPPGYGPAPALQIGMCLPDSCSQEDGAAFVNTVVDLLPINMTLPKAKMSCQEKSIEFTDKALAVTIVGAVFAGIILLATTYDVFIQHVLSAPKSILNKQACQLKAVNGVDNVGFSNIDTKEDASNGEVKVIQKDKEANGHVELQVETEKDLKTAYKSGILGKLLLSFSVYTNAPKILSTNQPKGALTCVNGIRFLSMSWVILGHSIAFGAYSAENMATFAPKMFKRFTFQAVLNGTFSVDTFFVLSGLLVSYLSLREMKKRGGAAKFNWLLFYFHRYWRLTPPYMLVLMLYVPTIKYWASGPWWPQTGIDEDNECKTTWWKNLIYLNNVWDSDKQCMGWSWYLANDMQFYVICPIMLVPLFYSAVAGGVACLALIAVTFISAGIISSQNEFPANIMFRQDTSVMTELYFKPWTRIAPYAVGFFTGYILYRTDCKVKMSKLLNMTGWALATAMAMSVLYGLHTSDGLAPDLSNGVSSLYNATSRTAWGISVAWVIFACATGYGGPVNALLSWPGVIPLSRLTYCAYLVHPLVMYYYFMSRHALMFWDDVEIIYIFLGNMCVSYAVAFVVSLSFESPMMGLEKVLLGRSKNS